MDEDKHENGGELDGDDATEDELEDGELDEEEEEGEDVLEEADASQEEIEEMEKELDEAGKKELDVKGIKQKRKIKEKYFDDGDDKAFARRLKRHQAELELARIEGDGEEEVFKDLGHDFRLSRTVWDTLYPFQKIGVQWLLKLYRERVGGILADEMGLGKTIQTLAFLKALYDSNRNRMGSHGFGSTLILCPASIIVQWTKYCHKYLPLARTIIFHSSGSFKGKLASLAKRFEPRRDGLFVIVPYTTFMAYSPILSKKEWRSLVLDEAHIIKNPELRLTKALKVLATPHRLLLTGTPLQNNLKELWSLVDCAYPGRLGSMDPFMKDIANPITRGGFANASPMMKETAVRCAHILRNAIGPYLLRRTKAGVERELNLPNKQEQVLFCELTTEQRALYVEFLHSRACQRMIEAKNTFLPFAGITILRKLCNHPHLIGNAFAGARTFAESTASKAFGHPSLSGKLEVTRRLLALWKKQGSNKVLLFSQSRVMLDVIEAMLLRDGHTYLRMDGSTPISARDGIVSKYSQDESIFVFVLTTRVGGLGLNLTSANKVLIFDPCWNPSTDSQARERAWRIGQRRDVTIYRLITYGTIEEKIYHRQLFKEYLAQRVLTKKAQQRLELSTTDIRDLFTLCDDKEERAGRAEKKKAKREEKLAFNQRSDRFDQLVSAESGARKKEPADADVPEDEESLPTLTDDQRAALVHEAATSDPTIVPEKCERSARPADSAELFDGKYQIPYLVKHTKARRDRKKEEEEKAAKTEDGVMAFLLKRGVREALNHDAVLGYTERKKVEEHERRARGLICEKEKTAKAAEETAVKLKKREVDKPPTAGQSFLAAAGSRFLARPGGSQNDLLSAVRKRKSQEQREVEKCLPPR